MDEGGCQHAGHNVEQCRLGGLQEWHECQGMSLGMQEDLHLDCPANRLRIVPAPLACVPKARTLKTFITMMVASRPTAYPTNALQGGAGTQRFVPAALRHALTAGRFSRNSPVEVAAVLEVVGGVVAQHDGHKDTRDDDVAQAQHRELRLAVHCRFGWDRWVG